ncbi:MAG TPA: hypothetical protein VFK80_00590, partial [Limnochordia bacterium]|nr:hypothetical protein [Limnochordia bacterium]
MKIPESTPGIVPSTDGARVTELPVAAPGPGEVLIDVQASLASPETPQRTAVAGVVVALGEGVPPERMKRAERVVALAAHARYAVARADQCIKLPHRVAFEVGLLVIGDGLGLPFAAIARSGIRAGAAALVVGLNAAGLGAAVLLTHLGVSVVAADPDPDRRQSAHGLGVVRAVDPNAPEALHQIQAAAPRLTHAFACGAGSLGFAV